MRAPRRTRVWVWAGRVTAIVILAGLVGYLVHVGLDTADKLASSIGVVIALAALFAPYLLPAPGGPPMPDPDPDCVEDSGAATATAGGRANAGLQAAGRTGPGQVKGSGNASADGSGSVANTGIQYRPEPNP